MQNSGKITRHSTTTITPLVHGDIFIKAFGHKDAPRTFHGTTAAGEQVKSAKTMYDAKSGLVTIVGKNDAKIELTPGEFEVMARDALRGLGYSAFPLKSGSKS
jgi:hypothetical protein